MTNQRVAGVWHQIKGKAKEQWGKLTEDDLKQLEGHAEQLAGKLARPHRVLDHIAPVVRPGNFATA